MTVYIDTCPELNKLPFGVTEIVIKANICYEYEKIGLPPSVDTVVIRGSNSTGSGGGSGNSTSFSGNGVSTVYVECPDCQSFPSLSFPEVQQLFIADGSFPTATNAIIPFLKLRKLIFGSYTYRWCVKFAIQCMIGSSRS